MSAQQRSKAKVTPPKTKAVVKADDGDGAKPKVDVQAAAPGVAEGTAAVEPVQAPEPPTVEGTDLSTQRGADVEALREERAKRLEHQREAAQTKVDAEVEAADEVGMHVAKIDDPGALEQQRAARDLQEADTLEGLEGPPVVAPVIEAGTGSFMIVSRRDEDVVNAMSIYDPDSTVDQPREAETPLYEPTVTTVDDPPPEPRDYTEVGDTARFVGSKLYIIGEDLPFPGEVIIDVRRQPNAQDHQRFSTWTEDGSIDVPLPGINGIGDWEFFLSTTITQVGEGRDDGLVVVQETEPQQLELY